MSGVPMEDDLTCSDAIRPSPFSSPAAGEEPRVLLRLSSATSFDQEREEDAAAEISPPTPLRCLKREVTLEIEQECKKAKLDDDDYDEVYSSPKNGTPSKRRVKFCSPPSKLPLRTAKKADPTSADLVGALEQATHFSSLLDRIRAEKLKKQLDQQHQGEQEAGRVDQQRQDSPQEPPRRRYQRRNSFVVHRRTGKSMGLSLRNETFDLHPVEAATSPPSSSSSSGSATLGGYSKEEILLRINEFRNKTIL